jgi:hypothetical protein
MATSSEDLKSITETARDLAYRQLDAQGQSFNNFDSKTVGVLGFDAAALAAILAGKDLFHGWWGVPAVGIVVSALFAILAIRSFNWDIGPDPRVFYEKATKGGAPKGSSVKANVELVSDLGGPLGSLAKNDRVLQQKSEWFLWALGTAVLTATVSAIIIGFL